MANSPAEPLNFGTFWSLLGKLVVRLMKERMHGEVVLVFHEGNLSIVRVNRSFLPGNLPEV
jgi:hypothetical protein